MTASLLLLGLLAISATGLPRDGASERAQQVAEATNSFGVGILKALPKRENAFISPLSIVTALSMLYAGARGSTAQELRTALNFDKVNLGNNNVHPAFREILNHLTTPSDKYTLDVANKALTRSDFHVLDDYAKILENNYQAQLEEVDFQNEGEAVKNQVNQWVNLKTRGKINSLLDSPPDPSTVLLLLNAVYFKGNWETPFEKRRTRPVTFYNNGENSNARRVPTMHLKMDARYGDSRELESKLLELPYAGNDLSMVFILPEKRNGLDELEEKLTNENLQKAIQGLSKREELDIKIPKFKLEKEYTLNNVLQAIGINEVFGDQADLSGITRYGGLKVSKVIHKAVVEVNEEGSEAAAITGVEAVFYSALIGPKPTFYADHPFLFAIREKNTGLVLFLGRVNNL